MGPFHIALYIRDEFCLLTDQPPGQAAHIVPQSRPGYYCEVLGHDPINYFNVAFGLLLKSDAHHVFDRGDWVLFPSPSDPTTLTVHIFNEALATDFHGKQITRERVASCTHESCQMQILYSFTTSNVSSNTSADLNTLPQKAFSSKPENCQNLVGFPDIVAALAKCSS